MKFLLFVLISISFVGCAGYRLQNQRNPFYKYGISRVWVPNFYNKTPLPKVAATFTKNFIEMLGEFEGLELVSSPEKSDGVLLGIIQSAPSHTDVLIPTDRRKIEISASAESRRQSESLYVPTNLNIKLGVRIILLKGKSAHPLQEVQSPTPLREIIFDNVLNALDDQSNFFSSGEWGQTNFSKGLGQRDQTIDEMAQNTSEQFRRIILDAF